MKTKYMKGLLRNVLPFMLMLLITSSVFAQDEVQILQRTEQGDMIIQVNGETFLAFPEARARQMLIRADTLQLALEAEKQKFEVIDSLNQRLKAANTAYVEAYQEQDSLITQTWELYEGYRDLNRLYRKGYSEPWVTLHGGLGAVRERVGETRDILPVVLVGLSVKRLSLHGFVNLEQSGFIIGLNQPIRLF